VARSARHGLARQSRITYTYVLHDLAARLEAARITTEAPAGVIVSQVDAWMTAKNWSANTCCTQLGIVRPFLDWCAVRGFVADGVTRDLRNPRQGRRLPRAQTKAQVAQLLAVVPDARGRAIVLLMAQCGLRRAEVAAIRTGDLDMLEGALLVHGKGDKERMTYLSEETMEAVRAWMVERGPGHGALISSYEMVGRPITRHWVGKMVSGWMSEAGLKSMPGDGVSGHALRHTAATAMLRGGANIRVVQEAMGHQNITTTARYLRADDDEVRAAMRSLNYGSRRLRAVGDP
jgi:site-specific recombinase XerD